MRTLRLLATAFVGLAGLWGVALGGTAAAQTSDLCRRDRAELASFDRHGGSGTREELARLTAYYRTIDCEGGRFLFFDTRPPQCEAVAQRIRYLSAQPLDDGYTHARRRQLTAAISAHCDAQGPAGGAAQTARGGGQVICVRTCDGGYFPMNNLPEGRDGADAMCQALCPGAQAVAYSMPSGDDALRQAASVEGRRAYTALPNAFKFRTALTPDCSCKKEGQTWVQALAKAESMLDRHKGDVMVTAAQAERLSRPKVRLLLMGRADRAASAVADVAASAAGIPSAAVGPRLGDGSPAVPAAAPGAVGEEHQVRVIAPERIPVPRNGTL